MINKPTLHKPLLLTAAAFVVLVAGPLGAVELLTDGGFEYGAAVPGWELEESIYDQKSR